MLVAQKISETAVDDNGLAVDRVVVTKVTIRDKPAETPEPFSTEPAEDLSRYRAVLDTSLGEITLSFTPDKAPNHVRNFLRLAQSGVYDGMSFHRVVKGFVIQSGHLPTRGPLGETQQKYVRQMKAEFNDQLHDKGTLSMARLSEPDSASTSFFIVTAQGAGARRSIHRVWQSRERPRCGGEDRGGGRERRDAGRSRRAEEGNGRETVRHQVTSVTEERTVVRIRRNLSSNSCVPSVLLSRRAGGRPILRPARPPHHQNCAR